MDGKRLREIFQTQFDRCLKVTFKKSSIYAEKEDRLSNFYRAGDLNKEEPEKALWGMASKHVIALADFINDLNNGVIKPREEWEEKITDIINYLVLLKALLEERGI